jgi:hypothetical protein
MQGNLLGALKQKFDEASKEAEAKESEMELQSLQVGSVDQLEGIVI